MIKIAYVDDERNEQDYLNQCCERLQEEIGNEVHVFPFFSGEDFLKNYDYSFDIICLDIELDGGMDGIQTAREIRKLDEEVPIIFVTNMAQMAICGYEVQALDFLVKPVNYYSFSMKLRNAINVINNRKNRNIIIMTNNGVRKICTNDLYFVEVSGHYLFYHTSDGVFRQKNTLKDAEEKLKNFSFRRCNNCYLVNLRHVNCVDKDELQIADKWLKISRPKRKEFLQSLANYLGGAQI